MQTDFTMYGSPVASENTTGRLKEVYTELQEM